MPSKTEEYLALAQRTANGLTRYWESWTDYLTTASRLYKYPFADQLMIYAQRPDATACADFDIWNNRMNRYVRRGAKGIALLDESSGFPRLHYVFDVSDTGVRRNSRDPEVWQYNNDLKQPVSEMLNKTYASDNSKLNVCVQNVLKIWEEGKDQKLTQLLFCDLSTPKNDGNFNVYEDIRKKLVAAGVPENEIEFIHNADTEAKKAALFSKVRSGDVRVLLGSTAKMGAGTNVQSRLVAVHESTLVTFNTVSTSVKANKRVIVIISERSGFFSIRRLPRKSSHT